MDTKDCLNCGRSYERPSWANGPKWRASKFCSLSCANSFNRRHHDVPTTKVCEHCGDTFERPASYKGDEMWLAKRFCSRQCNGAATRKATAERKGLRACPVCGVGFVWRYENQVTCRGEACKREYARTVSGPAASARMRVDYAAGTRRKAAGISPRETALWPLLAPHGWLWRLRWIEAGGEFELDFSHERAMVNVEIDGEEHGWTKRRTLDEARDEILIARGWTVVRISNAEVDANPEAVAARILALAAPIVAA